MEHIILSNLVHNDKYTRDVLPFIKPEYFTNDTDRLVFKHINRFVEKYNALPSKEALYIELSNDESLNEKQFESARALVAQLEHTENTDAQWLLDQSEAFCQSKAIYNAIHKAIAIYDKKIPEANGRIPQLLQDAIAVSFDTTVGHDFIDDSDSRYDSYSRVEKRIATGLHYVDLITKGGFPRKTFNVLIGPTGAGKTLCMCSIAANMLMMGYNVLYITLEMAEDQIGKRIDQNLLDMTEEDLIFLGKDKYKKKMDALKTTMTGRLKIKEYPTSSAHVGHFRHLLSDLKLKQKFIPDVIFVDYVNICASSRMKMSGDSYGYIKAIAEELRGLCVEQNVTMITATQSNRDSFSASDFDLRNTSESIGLPMTADFMLAIIVTEELDELGQIMFKQLKNRYSDPAKNRRFVVGVEKSKMKLFDVEQSAQEGLLDGPEVDRPVMDGTRFGEEDDERSNKQFGRHKFKGFR